GERGICAREVDGREERPVAEQVLRQRERPRRGVKDVGVEETPWRRRERVRVPAENPLHERRVRGEEPSAGAVERLRVEELRRRKARQGPQHPRRRQGEEGDDGGVLGLFTHEGDSVPLLDAAKPRRASSPGSLTLGRARTRGAFWNRTAS